MNRKGAKSCVACVVSRCLSKPAVGEGENEMMHVKGRCPWEY